MAKQKNQDAQISTPKQAILQVIAAIPVGQVCSYGGVAKRAGFPSHARYVGTVLKHLPTHSKIPWHRVVNGKGLIAFPIGSGKWYLQKTLLEQEGVIFDEQQPHLKAYFW